MDLLLVAFGSFFVTQWFKTVVQTPLHGWVKMTLAAAVALLLAATLGETGTMDERLDVLAMTAAGAGVAAVVHKVHRWISVAGDAQTVAVMRAGIPRR